MHAAATIVMGPAALERVVAGRYEWRDRAMPSVACAASANGFGTRWPGYRYERNDTASGHRDASAGDTGRGGAAAVLGIRAVATGDRRHADTK